MIPDRFMPKLRKQHIDCEKSLLLGVLMDRRKIWICQLAQIVVIKAHNGFVVRNEHALFTKPRHNARGKNIRRGEDAGDLRLIGKQMSEPLSLLHKDLLRENQ